ncbi:hypothetical protein SEPCBS119000_005080 [Sporothrix epigloea]|uniref:Cell surface protein n=1 Tax=Sporothrix epigloea TaxID=1892477 RepID=A0ABP0DVM4_9PEZI
MSSIVNKIKDVVEDKLHNNHHDNATNTSSTSTKNNLENDVYDSTNTRTSGVPQQQQTGFDSRSGNASEFADNTYSSGGAGPDSAAYSRGTGSAGGAGAVAGRSNLDSADMRSGGLNSGVGNDYQSGLSGGRDPTYGGSSGISGAQQTDAYTGSSGIGGVQQTGGHHHHHGHHAGAETVPSNYEDPSATTGYGSRTGATSTGRTGAIGDEFGAVGSGRANEFGTQTGRGEFATQGVNEFGATGQPGYDSNVHSLKGVGRGGYTDGNTGINTVGRQYQDGTGVSGHTISGHRDPTDAAQVPPSVLAQHVGEPIVGHGGVANDRIRRNSSTSHQETFRGI